MTVVTSNYDMNDWDKIGMTVMIGTWVVPVVVKIRITSCDSIDRNDKFV